MLLDVAGQHRRCEEIVRRNVEKALDLPGMEIEGEHAVRAGGGHQIGDELCRNWRAGAGFAVLPGIAEIGDHCGDAARGSAAQRIHDDQRFHQVIVCRIGGRLDHEYVLAADVFLNFHEDFHIGEAAHDGLRQGQVQIGGNGFGKGPVGIARYEFHSVVPAIAPAPNGGKCCPDPKSPHRDGLPTAARAGFNKGSHPCKHANSC